MTHSFVRRAAALSLAIACVLAPVGVALAASEQQNLEELRNTVINLLQALVEQGVMTRAKAEELVKQAQAKAAESAAQKAHADDGAVRVPYVPQMVKDEISKQVAEQVTPAVVAAVLDDGKKEGWAVPGALPEWLKGVRAYGDVTLRGQADLYSRDNPQFYFVDVQSVNQAGGLLKAGANEFLNVTEDRYRMRLRARLGLEAQLPGEVTSGIRLSSGSLTDPSSASQTLGTNSARYAVGIDEAFIRWDPKTAAGFNYFSVTGGRIPNPWFAPTELVYARDLTFEGVAATGRLGIGDGSAAQSHAYFTLGALPVQDVSFANPSDKWLLGAQLGASLRFGESQRANIAAAYYDFVHVSGIRNPPDAQQRNFNYTAPAFVRYGNSVFDISNNPTDPTVALFGLAARFRLVNVAVSYELPLTRYQLSVNAEAVRNVGDNVADIFNRTGKTFPLKSKGYVADVTFGDRVLDHFGSWRAKLGYRYVQGDAVLDSWTDADFHGGGTDARGFYVWTEFGLTKSLYGRLRYLSANEIDSPPSYGYDIIQLDLLSHF